ncbi:MAG: hypothetical protein U0271_45695 [Polyangiaceae bacterium]
MQLLFEWLASDCFLIFSRSSPFLWNKHLSSGSMSPQQPQPHSMNSGWLADLAVLAAGVADAELRVAGALDAELDAVAVDCADALGAGEAVSLLAGSEDVCVLAGVFELLHAKSPIQKPRRRIRRMRAPILSQDNPRRKRCSRADSAVTH